jgi:hypothetical protein
MAQLTDHIHAEELFSAYIDQRTTADEQAFVERHVAACADCRAQLQATRSMVAALKAMPVVKAPRSFVLPKSMAVQPKPSIFNWYPTLRLATAFAAIAFVLVFAGDLLTVRPAGGGNLVMSASSPAAEAPAAPIAPQQAPAPAEPLAKSAPADQQPPSAEPAPAGAAPAAGNAARVSPTPTMETADANATTLSAQAAPTETIAADAMTDTVEMTATTALAYDTYAPTPAPAAESAVETPAPIVTTSIPPAFDLLRLASIVLGGLAVVLGVVTLMIRRGA